MHELLWEEYSSKVPLYFQDKVYNVVCFHGRIHNQTVALSCSISQFGFRLCRLDTDGFSDIQNLLTPISHYYSAEARCEQETRAVMQHNAHFKRQVSMISSRCLGCTDCPSGWVNTQRLDVKLYELWTTSLSY